MVKQTRHIFDLTDVSQVLLRCRVGACTGEVANSLADFEVPDRCPQCKEEWEAPKGGAWALIRQMKEMVEGDQIPMSIRFAIDADKEAR